MSFFSVFSINAVYSEIQNWICFLHPVQISPKDFYHFFCSLKELFSAPILSNIFELLQIAVAGKHTTHNKQS